MKDRVWEWVWGSWGSLGGLRTMAADFAPKSQGTSHLVGLGVAKHRAPGPFSPHLEEHRSFSYPILGPHSPVPEDLRG